MDRKIAVFISIIICFGILSISGLAKNYYKPNKFEIGTGDHSFTWKLYSNDTINSVEVTVPEVITPENIKISGKKAEIELKTKNIKRGVYTVSALTFPTSRVYTAAVMVGITTDDELNEVKNDIDDIEDRMDDAESNINSVEDDVSTLTEDLSSIQDSLDTAKTDISNLEQSLSDEEKKRKGLGAKIENVKTQISNLEGRLDESKERLNKLESTTATGMIITSASLGIGVIILVFILIYVAYRKGWIESLKRLIREKALKKEPWEK